MTATTFSVEALKDDPTRKIWDRTVEADTLEVGPKAALRLGWENRPENPLLASPDRKRRIFQVDRIEELGHKGRGMAGR